MSFKIGGIMSYEKELPWEFGQTIAFEYSTNSSELKLDKWRLFYKNMEIVPTREIADEIEVELANWLETEYSKYGYSYKQEMREANWLSSRG